MANYQLITFQFLFVSIIHITSFFPRCQAHFRDHRHARQQCTLAGRVRHARTCFHTHDAALCAGHEQQPERGDEQCEGTSGAIDVRHTIKAVPGGWLFLYQDSSGITAILSISYLQI